MFTRGRSAVPALSARSTRAVAVVLCCVLRRGRLVHVHQQLRTTLPARACKRRQSGAALAMTGGMAPIRIVKIGLSRRSRKTLYWSTASEDSVLVAQLKGPKSKDPLVVHISEDQVDIDPGKTQSVDSVLMPPVSPVCHTHMQQMPQQVWQTDLGCNACAGTPQKVPFLADVARAAPRMVSLEDTAARWMPPQGLSPWSAPRSEHLPSILSQMAYRPSRGPCRLLCCKLAA